MSKVLAQVLEGHGRALDVPPGPTRAPRAVPGGLARLGRLPQREVEGICLSARPTSIRAPGDQLLLALVGKLAVLGKRLNAEKDVSLGSRRRPLVDQTLDHLDDLGDVLGDLGIEVGPLDAQAVHALEIRSQSTVLPARPASTPLSLARSMILSSTSVKFCIRLTRYPSSRDSGGRLKKDAGPRVARRAHRRTASRRRRKYPPPLLSAARTLSLRESTCCRGKLRLRAHRFDSF